MKILNAIRAEFFDGLRPEPVLPLAEYIERHMWLAQGQSASPGAVELWQFQRELADALADPDVERVTVKKGARLGYTTLLFGAIAHFIRQRPTSIIAAVPTDDDIAPFVVGLETAFAASPTLRDTLPMPHAGRHTHRDTLKFRHGPGWSLRLVASRAPRQLRSHAAEVVIADEVSAMEVTPEGHAVPLLEKRSMTFPRRKIIIGSTPGESSSCYVSASYELGDGRIFEVPCFHCGSFNEITWDQIQWASGKPETAGYVCPSCGGFHDDTEHKPEIVSGGRWRALRPDIRDHRSYRLNCLVAPHAPAAWPRLAAEFLVAKRTVENLKVFTTSILGQAWDDEDHSGPQPHELMALSEDVNLDKIPPEVLYMCSGVDIQTGGGGRLEISTIGFSEDDHWFALDHRVIFGDPMRDEVWKDLSDWLGEKHQHPLGGLIDRSACVIDAGDGNVMARVLAFCGGNRRLRCIPVKGVAGPGRAPLTPTASKRNRSLQMMGSDTLKTRILDRLSRRAGITFSRSLEESYFEQLLSERQVVRYSRGRPTRIFERVPGRNAEALDCFVMGLAARSAVVIPSPRREAELSGRPVAAPMPTVIRSAWLDR
jgi:phage terminase large subunit GpA-like protein